jgi:hypothetical protein
MAEERYWVQIAYQRPPVAAPNVLAAAVVVQVASGDKSVRVLTPEQEQVELQRQRATDHPRIRQIFDILDAPSKGRPLPDGVRLNQGDLVAPGLILDENPFPDWFHAEMVKYGWEYNRGNVSFMLGVDGKQKAEAWYFWVMEILKRMKEHEKLNGAPALSESIGVYIREDHSPLWNDELTKSYT